MKTFFYQKKNRVWFISHNLWPLKNWAKKGLSIVWWNTIQPNLCKQNWSEKKSIKKVKDKKKRERWRERKCEKENKEQVNNLNLGESNWAKLILVFVDQKAFNSV